MTGTAGDIIPIVIVPILVLAFWLVMMYHANSHPGWRGQARADTASTHTLEGSVPAQRLSSPGPVCGRGVCGCGRGSDAPRVSPV